MYKLLPPSAKKYIFPPHEPDTNYTYFKDCENHPFQPDTHEFQMVNAWWLADATLAAYLETLDTTKKAFRATGLEVEQICKGKTQLYMAYNQNFVIVTFRGTRLNRLQDLLSDILTDLNCSLVTFEDSGCVHQGFNNELSIIWDSLYLRLIQLYEENSKRTFWFTGHSLGAALATLAAHKTVKKNARIDVRGVYTFGSPCVGDKFFKKTYLLNSQTYRFVNSNDYVARLLSVGIYPHPKLVLTQYHHVGNVKYIDSKYQIHHDIEFWQRLVDSFEGSFKHIYEIAKRFRFKLNWEEIEIPIDHFAYHAPIYYAIHIWNYYESHLEA
jgi:triacylglycerol lipase